MVIDIIIVDQYMFSYFCQFPLLLALKTCLSDNINIKLLEKNNACGEIFLYTVSKTGNAFNSLIIK